MKKIAYLSILAGLFMVGCTEMAQPADPQTNEQEALITISGAVTATAVPTINLAEVETDSVAVATVTHEITSSEAAEYKYYVTLDSAYEYEVAADMKIPVADLQALVEEVYGKRPVERTFSAVVTVSAVVRGSAVLYKSEKFDIVLVPQAPYIDTAYYLVGDMCGWDKATALKFNHSGKDVYEDAVFTITVQVPDADGNGADYWKIIPGKNYDSEDGFWAEGVLGVETDGDDALEGKLITADPQAAKINFNTSEESMNLYKITLDMMAYSYTVEELNFVEYLYVPGNHQGWNPGAAPALHGPAFNGVWTGFTMLDGGFKFVHQRDWGADYVGEDFAALPDGFSTEGGDIFAPTPKALYYVKVDMTTATLSASAIKTFGIIGTPTEWSSDIPMTWDDAKQAYVATDVELSGEIKFRANNDWPINLGGTPDNLVADGANLTIEEGTYDVELYLQRTDSDKIYATFTKK